MLNWRSFSSDYVIYITFAAYLHIYCLFLYTKNLLNLLHGALKPTRVRKFFKGKYGGKYRWMLAFTALIAQLYFYKTAKNEQ